VTGSDQLPLSLPHRPALDREDFLVAEANATAVAWIDVWPAWPQPVLVLYGPAGCGKSHLGQVWCRRSGASQLDRARLVQADPPELLAAGQGAALLDDADRLLAGAPEPAQAERQLLHLTNLARERGGHLLLTARTPPARWPLGLPDLRSRLAAATCVELGAPDDTLIEAVLVKLFSDRQLRVPPEVVRFLLPRMERSFAAARQLVDALDAASLAQRREITVPLARRVLAGTGSDPEGAPDPAGGDGGA
jgi:DnaA regulatory inactivator Hda